ncbi:MAG: M15 family metallopeptidase [Butyrivibrio sp.]|nr:M15 family metallopeptidase [Butyrivibrio sp.]
MNAGNSVKKYSFKEKIISKVERFNRKHKALSFLGLGYALIAIFIYNILFYFYSNVKRFTCLACILLFFVSSSSFSYPGMSLNISFATEISSADNSGSEEVLLSETEVAESEAELAVIEDVDETVIAEALESENPDVAEAEQDDPDKKASLDDILNANENIEVVETEKISEDNLYNETSDVTFSSDDWKIILVNKQHPIPDDYEFPLGVITGSMRCDERIISPLLEMMKAASSDGISLIICSPYRDMGRQTMLFNTKVEKYMYAGMSYMDAYNLASQAVTVPGSSEHQIGLAIDIVTDSYSILDEGFGRTAAGKWLSENSYKYGFILRYPAGKETITSIEFEPWHFRYVGVDAATFMVQNDICLEELWSTYVN